MIDFKNLTKTYSGEYILKDVNCRINTGERVGVVGPNGAGKSTLFGIVTGEVIPDGGSVVIPKDSRLGIMRQHIAETDLDRELLEFTADAIPELKRYSAELEQLEEKMAICDNDDEL
jgi:ATP-binding cassette subfamily F protein 3